VDLISNFHRLAGNNDGVLLLCNLLVGLDVSLAKQELSCLDTSVLFQSGIDHVQGLGTCFSLNNHRFSCSLGFQDGGALFSFGYVDVSRTVSLRGEDVGTLTSLGFSLQDHRFLNVGGRLDVLNLIAESEDTPIFGFLVNRLHDVLIQGVSFLKSFV
jgi:hypothetical protein